MWIGRQGLANLCLLSLVGRPRFRQVGSCTQCFGPARRPRKLCEGASFGSLFSKVITYKQVMAKANSATQAGSLLSCRASNCCSTVSWSVLLPVSVWDHLLRCCEHQGKERAVQSLTHVTGDQKRCWCGPKCLSKCPCLPGPAPLATLPQATFLPFSAVKQPQPLTKHQALVALPSLLEASGQCGFHQKPWRPEQICEGKLR